MVNQWGRDGTSSRGSGGQGSSTGGIIISALVALIIGAGGGYAGGRLLGGTGAAEISARDKQIAELTQTLSEMKLDSQSAGNQQDTQRARIKDLESQVAQLKRTKETLKTYADTKASDAARDAQAEIAALKQTIEQAGDLSGQLSRARKSMKVSELQIIELEKANTDQRAQIEKLKTMIAKPASQNNPAIAVLQAEKETLEIQLSDAKAEAATVPELKSRIALLEDQLTEQNTKADAAAQQQIAKLQKQKDALGAQLDAALKSAADANAQSNRIIELQSQLDQMTDKLAERDKVARDAGAALKQTQSNLDTARADAQALQVQNKALAKAQSDLTKKVASLNKTIADLKAAAAVDNPPPTNDAGDNGDQQSNALTPRQRQEVEKAVADLPGFDKLSSGKQATLLDMLERGECVTDSLKAAYGHVSPIALRSLFRDLGGGC